MGDLVQRLRDWPPYADEDALMDEAADRIDALTAEVERLKGQDWQPIETAPKNGTCVLVVSQHGSWFAGFFVAYWAGDHWAYSVNRRCNPTHWRPLPTPPASQEGQADG